MIYSGKWEYHKGDNDFIYFKKDIDEGMNLLIIGVWNRWCFVIDNSDSVLNEIKKLNTISQIEFCNHFADLENCNIELYSSDNKFRFTRNGLGVRYEDDVVKRAILGYIFDKNFLLNININEKKTFLKCKSKNFRNLYRNQTFIKNAWEEMN